MNQQLNEGLRPNDLKEMVYPIFEIDTFKSKMGEDRDVCVLSFRVKDRSPAKDMMEFIEKGFNQVLDADISAGENENGEYSVFVEIKRTPRLAEDIKDLLYGIKKLTSINEFSFKYYKNDSKHEVTEETIKKIVPSTPRDYEKVMLGIYTEGIKKFFSRTLMDDLTVDGNIITVHKPFDRTVQFKIIKEDDSRAILESNNDYPIMDEEATSETLWLTKVMGDYDITKYGESFLFTNGDRSMFLQRVG